MDANDAEPVKRNISPIKQKQSRSQALKSFDKTSSQSTERFRSRTQQNLNLQSININRPKNNIIESKLRLKGSQNVNVSLNSYRGSSYPKKSVSLTKVERGRNKLGSKCRVQSKSNNSSLKRSNQL